MESVKRLKRLISVIVLAAILLTATLAGTLSASAASTGTGLSEWVLNAYNSGWSYVYGGTSPGAVDCSGLIATYNGVGGTRSAMMDSSPETGSVYNGIPNIHGLGLWQPGHVGVYVGGGMAVDARNEYYGVCYENAESYGWVSWFKVYGVSYPTTGWEYFNGNYYYYENGEYLTSTSRTIGGVTYSFGSSGVSDKSPSDTSAVADNSSQNNGNSNSSSSSAPKVIKKGDSGEAVFELQSRLKELGFYTGEVTAYFGDATETAYKAFQKVAGVTVDGIAGESDLEILYSDDAPNLNEKDDEDSSSKVKTYSLGDVDDDIKTIQEYLKNLGYFDSDITTYFGELTKSALLKFQQVNGLEETGIADEATLELLFSNSALQNPETDDEDSSDSATEILNLLNANSDDALDKHTIAQVQPRLSNSLLSRTNQIAAEAISRVAKDNSGADNGGALTVILWIFAILAIMSAVVFTVYKYEQAKIRSRRAKLRASYHRYYNFR